LAVLRLRDVVVRYARNPALSVAEFAVAPGEVVALIGPNGAGKSTLLQVAALLRQPDAGEVAIGGVVATRRTAASLRRHLTMVFQAPLLFDVDVLANAASGLRFRGVGRREAEARALAWLTRFGVAHLARRVPRTLSGGEAQRVTLARAFAVEPALLLLDEPFAALDAPARAALVPELARHLRETRTAAVVVTHDREEALALGDRLGVMLAGRIVQLDPPDEVMARPATAAVAAFLGIANVFPARVSAVAGDRVLVQPAGAAPPIAVCHRSPEYLVPGQLVDLALPAEMVGMLGGDGVAPVDWNTLPGVVVQNVPTPGGQRVTVDCGIELRSLVPRLVGQGGFAAGQPARVAFSPDAVHLMVRTDDRVSAERNPRSGISPESPIPMVAVGKCDVEPGQFPRPRRS
jgi:tungstate transport system ATP-binding protein